MEEKEWVTIMEAADAAGIGRTAIYNYLRELGIKPRKFPLDRRKYITGRDAARLIQFKKSPWMIHPDTIAV